MILIGCSNNNPSIKEEEGLYNLKRYPKWISNPTLNGRYLYGAVGSAGRSYRGPAHQRKLALQRALEELGAQIETTVASETVSHNTITDQRTSYRSETSSRYLINEKVSGKIMDIWEDKKNSQLYIWVVVE